MVNAEQFGVTQANVEAMRQSPNPEIRRMLGTESSYGQTLGVTNDWVVRIVKAVGNYGESFDRNLGAKSPLNLPRGLEPPVERRRPAVQPSVPMRRRLCPSGRSMAAESCRYGHRSSEGH